MKSFLVLKSAPFEGMKIIVEKQVDEKGKTISEKPIGHIEDKFAGRLNIKGE